jgi:hypothetical protein
MKKSELQKLIREEIAKVMTETYNNPEWKLSSIQGWIKTYAKNKGLNLNLVKQVDKKTDTGRSFAGSKSKTTFYIYDIGDKHGIVIKDDKVAGAPKLSEIDVIIGLKGSTPGALSKSHSISSRDGSNQELTKLLDKVLGAAEAKLVQLKTALNAYPKSHGSTAASKKIEIPKDAQIEIIEHPFEKQPNDSLIKYKGQEYVVVKSSLDKVLGTIKKGTDSKPIESFGEAELKNTFTKIGFPATKAEGYDDINGGPTLSVVFENTLDDENKFMNAYQRYQLENKALGLPGIESAYHVGGNKWKFQMEK